MNKKPTAIVFGITNNYDFALANVIIGIKKHCKIFWDDIIVYHNGIDKKTQIKINSILECKFIKFDETKIKSTLNEESIKKYSLLAFSRFEIFKLLETYKKVIWHDVDILIQADFSGLLAYADKSGFAATLNDVNYYVESNFFDLIPDYDMFRLLYNSGMLVVSDKINYQEIYKECYNLANKYNNKLRYLDQGIINLIIQKFNIEVENIDILKYCCHPTRKTVKDAIIIHAYGEDKFWNNKKLEIMFPEWQENNKKWENIVIKKPIFSYNKGITDNKNPKVSILMSVYNRYQYLSEAIESMLNQTFSDFELIVVIEYSNVMNDIQLLLESYEDSRIVIIKNNKKIGFANSLNVGLDIAKGEYIVRMDDDDISISTRLTKQVSFMDNNQDIGICGSFMQFFMGNNDVCNMETDPEILKISCLFKTPLLHPTVIMRKSILNKFNLRYNHNYFTEDYELWSRAVKHTKITNIPEILLKYRASGENTTVTASEKVNESHLNVMKQQFLENLDLNPSFDQLQLISQRIDTFQNIYNIEAAKKILNDFYKQILKANKKKGFYSQKLLEKVISKETSAVKQPSIKRIIKKILKPIYLRLINRINAEISNQIYNSEYQINKKIKNISEDLESIKISIENIKNHNNN